MPHEVETDGAGGKCYGLGGRDLLSAPVRSKVIPIEDAPGGWAVEQWAASCRIYRYGRGLVSVYR